MKRDLKNKLIFGVCSGLGNYLGLDASVVRLIFAASTLLGFGLPIIIYLVLAIIMPVE
jgi:phage shock protein C